MIKKKELKRGKYVKKIMVVFGTRPEAIKMGPIVLELVERSGFIPVVVTTGQHREMLNQVLSIFDINPDYKLDIMCQNQGLEGITNKVIQGLAPILTKEKPDMVLVHGDTTTSMAAALSAFYQQIPIGHVEAGLRTHNKFSPFPEEMNRQLTGKLADIHFSPTEVAKENLANEGIVNNVVVTGNTSIDALLYTQKLTYHHPLLEKIRETKAKMLLMTVHRRENLEGNIDNIFEAIRQLSVKDPNLQIVFPMHLNPKVREKAGNYFNGCETIHLIEPLDVVGFHQFMKAARLIITDSGGVQEEAPSLGVPVLVVRDTTERPEGVAVGTLKLVGADSDRILKESLRLINDDTEHDKVSKIINPYGNGDSSERIVSYIERYFEKKINILINK